MKNLLRATLPETLKRELRNARFRKSWDGLTKAWDATIPQCRESPSSGRAQRILIFPSDINLITGALGDDAMITASVEHFKRLQGDTEVEILCAPAAVDAVVAKGFVPLPLPPAAGFPSYLADHLNKVSHDAVVVLGADILDGYYNPTTSLLRLVAADIAARCGVPVTVLGASFNAKPASELKPVFDKLDSRVNLNLRDEISLDRLKKFADVTPRLVADSAFTLRPGVQDPATVAWATAERAAGRTILGMNVHPMLIKHATEAEVQKIVSITTEAITKASAGREISWLMLPHDYRGDRGDGRCLKPVHDRLAAEGVVRSHYLDGEHRAADLKAMAGLCEGVVTGRMHLAIAALGMGVPTLSLTYQDKFEGLYRHFGLPGDLLLGPAIFDDGDTLATGLSGFFDRLPELTTMVTARNPEVLALSEKNFDLSLLPV